MKSTTNGFKIAEKDLILRGPGDFFSSSFDDNLRQSGGFVFKFSKLCDDMDLFNRAFSVAKSIIAADPSLAKSENAGLKKALAQTVKNSAATIS